MRKITYQNVNNEIEDLMMHIEWLQSQLDLPGWENTKSDINRLLVQRVIAVNKLNKLVDYSNTENI
jgi:hypothetical protein